MELSRLNFMFIFLKISMSVISLVYTIVTFIVTVSTPMDHFRARAGKASMETVNFVLVGEKRILTFLLYIWKNSRTQSHFIYVRVQ